jgi:integrase
MSNPASRVKPPKVEKKQPKHFNEDQTVRLLEYSDKEVARIESSDALEHELPSLKFRYRKYQAILYIAIYGGLRLGEISGLKWDCINEKEGTLEVNQSLQYIPGQGTFNKAPKNESSERVISLPGIVLSILKEYKKAQSELRLKCGDAWNNTGYVFTRADGQPVHPYWATKWFKDYIAHINTEIMNDPVMPAEEKEKLLLPNHNFHTTRHTNATLLIAEGVNIRTVANLLGHSVPSTTINIYSHSLRSAEKEAANRLEGRLSKKNKEPAKSHA